MDEKQANFVLTKAINFKKKVSKNILKISCEVQNGKALIRISGTIARWNSSADIFKAAVDQAINSGITSADIYINSGGGDVFEASEIANEIARFTGTKTAILGAICASAATYIASICDTVIAKTNTQYMIHKPYGGVEGNADEIEAALKLLRNLQNLYASTYAKKTGLTVAKIEEMWVQDFWMNADEAKSKKFINQIDGVSAEVTPEDVEEIKAFGYKNIPEIVATIKSSTNTNQINIMKDILITALALAATANDAQVLAAIEGLKSKANQFDALQAKFDALQKTAMQDKIDFEIKAAKDNKQITDAQEAFYRKQYAADFEGTKAHVATIPKVEKLSDFASQNTTINVVGNVDKSKWTYAEWMEKDPKGLEAMAENEEVKFKALAKAHYGVEV